MGRRRPPMVSQRPSFLLLPDSPSQPCADVIREHHARQCDLRIAIFDETLELAQRARERNRRLAARWPRGALLVARLLDQALELVGLLGPALTGFLVMVDLAPPRPF